MSVEHHPSTVPPQGQKSRAPAAQPGGARSLLQRMETEELCRLRGEHRQAVDEELLRRLLPLARKLAARYRGVNEPLDDLVQVASLGLLRAIERFDPERGTSLVSFAIPTILGELKRHFRDTGWAVHVPRGAQEAALRVERAVAELTDRLGRSPQVDELAAHMRLDAEGVLDALEVRNAHFGTSLDAPVGQGDDEPVALGATLGHDDDGYGLVDTMMDLHEGIRRLPFQERTALELRYGQDLKQREIAERMACSQMQVSRLLSRAAKRLIDADEVR